MLLNSENKKQKKPPPKASPTLSPHAPRLSVTTAATTHLPAPPPAHHRRRDGPPRATACAPPPPQPTSSAATDLPAPPPPRPTFPRRRLRTFAVATNLPTPPPAPLRHCNRPSPQSLACHRRRAPPGWRPARRHPAAALPPWPPVTTKRSPSPAVRPRAPAPFNSFLEYDGDGCVPPPGYGSPSLGATASRCAPTVARDPRLCLTFARRRSPLASHPRPRTHRPSSSS